MSSTLDLKYLAHPLRMPQNVYMCEASLPTQPSHDAAFWSPLSPTQKLNKQLKLWIKSGLLLWFFFFFD